MGIFLIPLFVYLFLLKHLHVWDLLMLLRHFFCKDRRAGVERHVRFFFFFSVGPHFFLHSIEKEAAGLKEATLIVIYACENECNILLEWLWICKWLFYFQECIKIPDDFFLSS